MLRHLITFIDYEALIKRQASEAFSKLVVKSFYSLDRNKKMEVKSQNKSNMLVRKMNTR